MAALSPEITAKDVSFYATRAGAALVRKPKRTPLEDALSSGGSKAWNRSVELVRWMRQQFSDYHGSLSEWRANRKQWMAECQDIFDHRVKEDERRYAAEENERPAFFSVQNESLNLAASMCEFAAAQAEQDLFGGDPWFAAKPVGRSDVALADTIQKHIQWTFRDGNLVATYRQGVFLSAALGEVFEETSYSTETDEYEAPRLVLHAGKRPIMVDGKFISEDDVETDPETGRQRLKNGLRLPVRGNVELSWKEVFEKRQTVIREGIETTILHYANVAFREDAPALDLNHTNFYAVVEMSILDAIAQFNLDEVEARRLALAAGLNKTMDFKYGDDDELLDTQRIANREMLHPLGQSTDEQLLNMRVRLIKGYVKADPIGDGIARRMFVVFPPEHEDWLVFCNYLGNVSPRAELPVKCHVWEAVPHRLYGRGFFAKYHLVQERIDALFSAVAYRNSMHSNPVTNVRTDRLERGEDDEIIEIKPGLALKTKNDWKLSDAVEMLALPDLDERSMELLQLDVSMAQLRSGISSASQGDMSSLPENNTATGIRQLMSRAAVLLKKPIRGLRASIGKQFSYAVRLFYANFNRDEAFQWGEGENREELMLTAEQVRDLDIDVQMLLTQEQNQTKLESSQTATALFQQWLAIPEIEKANARPLYLQAIKALEFDQADTIIREPAPTIMDAITLLPQDQQQEAAAIVQAGAQIVAQAQQPTNVEAMPQQPPKQQTPTQKAA